ncbi:FtsX-like permease family protein [Zoogloea sp.]|uniref:FtsX-like permease family protein n=1 Tax=Zoogloea sp. TaxID=49181 RepID=UPI0035B40AF9
MQPDTTRRDIVLAFRNIVRQRRRSLFALATIAGGVIALMLAGGFIQWIFDSMRESTIRAQLGHVQIVRPGFYEKGLADPYSYLLPEKDPLFAKIGQTPGVRTIAPRLAFTGLASHNDSTISFSGEGVDPDREKELSTYLYIVDGEPLSADAPNGIIIGQGLAANLGVKTGDTIVLLAATTKGGLNAVECKVRGLFMTAAKAYDDAFLRAPLSVARQLSRAAGATSWLVLLDQTADTDRFIRATQAEADRKDLQFIPWHELADFYKKTVVLMSRQVGGVELLIALIIILSISNTLSMAVIERTGEIGTMMALGVRRNGVLRMFILEGLLLGTLGGLIGIVLGSLLGSLISYVGIPMPPPPGMSTGVTGRIHLHPSLIIEALSLAILTTLAASIFPAIKASRMNIVDALRHQR